MLVTFLFCRLFSTSIYFYNLVVLFFVVNMLYYLTYLCTGLFVVIVLSCTTVLIQADIVKKFRFFYGTVYEKLIGSLFIKNT